MQKGEGLRRTGPLTVNSTRNGLKVHVRARVFVLRGLNKDDCVPAGIPLQTNRPVYKSQQAGVQQVGSADLSRLPSWARRPTIKDTTHRRRPIGEAGGQERAFT